MEILRKILWFITNEPEYTLASAFLGTAFILMLIQ